MKRPATPAHLQQLEHRARRALMLVVLGIAIASAPFLFMGCAAVQTPAPSAPPAALVAACPPLSPEPKRQDVDALRLRAAEIASWYETCRDAALNPEPRRHHLDPPGWPAVPPSWGVRPATAASGVAP